MEKLETLYEIYLASGQQVSTDTRKINEGDIFFALSGPNFDGNQYVEDALNKGARYVVSSDTKYENRDNVMVVSDVLETLQELALHHRRLLNIPIIAITGSNGKTTTKELMNVVLSKKFSVSYTIGNLNNHIGIPLTLLKIKPFNEIAIVEMGANHMGEISSYCEYTMPDYGLITNIGKAHIEGFGSEENIKKGKGELYDDLIQNNKVIFVHRDDRLLMSLLPQEAKTYYYTTSDYEDIHVRDVSKHEFLTLEVKDGKDPILIETKLVGSYNLSNVMAAYGVGKYFEIPSDDIKQALESYIPSNNRSEVINKETNTIYLDAYNANPSSMEAALRNFSKITGTKLIILGSMKELGNSTLEEHQNIVNLTNKLGFDHVVLVGEEYSQVDTEKDYQYFQSFEDAKKWFDSLKLSQTHVLIKGSRALALERLID